MKKRNRFILFVLILSAAFTFGCTVMGEEQNTYISEEIQGYCIEIGEEYGILPELLMAMIEAESSGNPKAENGDCKGLMQISKQWHVDRMERLGVSDLFDPYGNILVGADYLSELFEQYGDLSLVLDVYNGNSKAFGTTKTEPCRHTLKRLLTEVTSWKKCTESTLHTREMKCLGLIRRKLWQEHNYAQMKNTV